MNLTQKSGSDRVRMRALTKQSFALLANWTYHFDLHLIQPSLFAAFEFNFATYFQETKIDDADVRRGIHGNVIIENFFYKQIHKWAGEQDPREEYCLLDDYVNAGIENNCHEFMAYVYIKALEDLNNRLGPDIVSLPKIKFYSNCGTSAISSTSATSTCPFQRRRSSTSTRPPVPWLAIVTPPM